MPQHSTTHHHTQQQHNNNNTRPFPPRVPISLCVLRHLARRPLAVDMMNGERASAGQRQRRRRLRAALRHERHSIAMALAEKLHRTSRGQRIPSARVEENEMNFAMGQMTPPPRAAAADYCPMTLEAGVRLAARGRPIPLVEVRPQGRVQRLTVEHTVDVSPLVQVLDVPLPQMGDQLVEFLKMHDTVTPEQVIALPKISCPPPSSSRGSQ